MLRSLRCSAAIRARRKTRAGLPIPSASSSQPGWGDHYVDSPPGGGVAVLDAPLTSSNGTTITGIEGTSIGPIAPRDFTDANQGATVADFTSGAGSVVVKWGDNSANETLIAGDLSAYSVRPMA